LFANDAEGKQPRRAKFFVTTTSIFLNLMRVISNQPSNWKQ